MVRLVVFTICLSAVMTSPLSTQIHRLRVGQVPPVITYTSYSTSKHIEFNSQDKQGTVYLIDFWATWCAPCIASIPKMDSLVEAFRGCNVKFVSIT